MLYRAVTILIGVVLPLAGFNYEVPLFKAQLHSNESDTVGTVAAKHLRIRKRVQIEATALPWFTMLRDYLS